MTSLLRVISNALQALHRHPADGEAAHLHTGREGETAAYLHLKDCGYRIVATNFRLPGNRGEIDLVAWDGDVLCFVEVKTRVGKGLMPPEAAVDAAKKDHIRSVARRYLRRLPGERNPACRFDIVSVTYEEGSRQPKINLIKGAFHWKTIRPDTRGLVGARRRREPWRGGR